MAQIHVIITTMHGEAPFLYDKLIVEFKGEVGVKKQTKKTRGKVQSLL